MISQSCPQEILLNSYHSRSHSLFSYERTFSYMTKVINLQIIFHTVDLQGRAKAMFSAAGTASVLLSAMQSEH